MSLTPLEPYLDLRSWTFSGLPLTGDSWFCGSRTKRLRLILYPPGHNVYDNIAPGSLVGLIFKVVSKVEAGRLSKLLASTTTTDLYLEHRFPRVLRGHHRQLKRRTILQGRVTYQRRSAPSRAVETNMRTGSARSLLNPYTSWHICTALR